MGESASQALPHDGRPPPVRRSRQVDAHACLLALDPRMAQAGAKTAKDLKLDATRRCASSTSAGQKGGPPQARPWPRAPPAACSLFAVARTQVEHGKLNERASLGGSARVRGGGDGSWAPTNDLMLSGLPGGLPARRCRAPARSPAVA